MMSLFLYSCRSIVFERSHKSSFSMLHRGGSTVSKVLTKALQQHEEKISGRHISYLKLSQSLTFASPSFAFSLPHHIE